MLIQRLAVPPDIDAGHQRLSFRASARNLEYCAVRFLLTSFVEMTG